MKHYLSQQYRNTVCKYKKFKTRFEKNVEQGVSAKKRRTLAQRLKKLYDQIVRLETQLKWAVSAGALSLALSAVPTAQTFAQQDKFVFVQKNFDFPPTGFVQTDAPVYPTFADLDNDGDLDLVLGLYGGGVLYYQRNEDEDTGNDVFTLIPSGDIRNPFNDVSNELDGYGYLSPSFADVDGDGDLDLIVGYSDFYYGAVTLFKNVDGRFVPFTGYANPFLLVSTYTNLAVGGARGEMIDIGDDGDLDLFVSGCGDDKYEIVVRYYENEETNSGSFSQRFGAENPLDGVSITDAMLGSYYASYGSLTFADVDGDGDLDAYIGEKYGSVYEYKNNGDDTFDNGARRNDLSFYFEYIAITPAFNDLDGDGDLDCLYGDRYYQTLPFALNDGNNSFTITTDVNTAADFSFVQGGSLLAPNQSAFKFGDVDGDGDQDAILFSTVAPRIRYFRNEDGEYNEITGTDNPFNGILATILPFERGELVDWDGDGDADLVTIRHTATGVRYYRNGTSGATGNFAQQTGTDNPFNGITLPAGHNYMSIFPVDVDGDGDRDAVLGTGSVSGNLLYYRNNGGGVWANQTGEDNPFGEIDGFYACPVFVDLDNDGDLDLALGLSGGAMSLYLNNGEQAFVRADVNPFSNVSVVAEANPGFADVDGDGDLDLFVGEFAGGTSAVYFFENVGNNFCPKIEEIRLATSVNTPYEFSKEQFQEVYSDEPDTKSKDFPKIRVLVAPSFGTLRVGGSVVNSGTEIPFAALGNLSYTPNRDYTGLDAFAWQAFDPVGQCYSNGSYVRFGIGTDVTGLDELNKLIGIYPNPSNGLFNINLDKGLVGKVDIQVYNALGSVVRSYNYSNPNEVEAIDLQAMPKGLYIVRISNQGKDGTIKIVKE